MSLTVDDNRKPNVGLIAVCIALAAGIFVMDLTVPLGVAGGVPYVAVVLVGMWLPGKRYLYIGAITCTGLTIIGYAFSPPGGELWQVIFNRFLALFVIWVTASLCLWKKGHMEAIEALSRFPAENPNPVFRLAKNGKILQANDPSRVLLNYWNREVGQDAPRDWRDQVLEVFLSSSRKNTVMEIDDRIFSFEIVPIPNAGYVNVYGRDITSFKKAERALQDSEMLFRAVLNNTVEGMITITERGIVELFNPAAERIFGFSWEEVVGENIMFLMPEPDKGKHDGYLKNYLRTGEAKIIGIGREVIGRRKDGLVFPMDLSVSEMFIGKKRLFIAVVRDITQRKQAEKEREALLEDLERANRELKDFAYVVSHDLKEPLRGISSLTQWITEDYADVLGSAGREQLGHLLENTQRMHHLIEGILAYSRIGRQKPVAVRLDSGKTAKVTVDSIAKSDTIDIRIEGAFPEVVYHEIHLEQIFQNLVGNAVKHLGKPSGEIVLSCRSAGEFWEFRVRDDGVGIPERHFERIFKMFETLDRKNYAESTGVGLALVKKITAAHGGKVWVESKVGQGSSFFFTVPKSNEIRSAS